MTYQWCESLNGEVVDRSVLWQQGAISGHILENFMETCAGWNLPIVDLNPMVDSSLVLNTVPNKDDMAMR